MTKRDVIRSVYQGRRPPYVPWHFLFTKEARAKVQAHYGPGVDLERALGNHILLLRRSAGAYENVDADHVRDLFGVEWDRSQDKDIGSVSNCLLPEPDLKNYTMPDPLNPRWFKDFDQIPAAADDRFRIFSASFSLMERAWTLRGLENLMIDFIENPRFVHELFDVLADFNVAQVGHVLRYDVDAVYFGDDWGSQHGLMMGRRIWDEFIRPRVQRMYRAVHNAGKFVMIHSCGDIDELFDDLIDLGVNCFNPFQPEVMDVDDLMRRYRGRVTFHGGLSTQRTLPFGSVHDVKRQSRHLIELGREGSYIFSPAHAVEGDVPLENILTFVECAQEQMRG